MHQATPSRLTVLLVTDIVGSTDLKGRIGLENYARLLTLHDELFKRLIATYPAAEILKDTGDGYFASFATTSDAVRFALRFQYDLHQAIWDPQPLRVRVGIHVGEVAQMEKEQTGKHKLVGIAADVVARVTQLAVGSQILLTRFAFNEARQFVSSFPAIPDPLAPEPPHLRWVAHGAYRLRGADEAIEVHEVGVEGIAPFSPPPGNDGARRAVTIDDEDTLGWRPAVGLDVPDRSQWTLERRLGAGGFGEVWLGRHAKLATRRVFKFCFDADRLRSFKRELTLFRLLRETLGDRTDIARLHEVKLDASPFFIESDYTEGGDLHEWSAAQGGLDKVPLETRLEIVARVADAVAAAHSVGVLHKDIKPSNILIDLDTGEPRPRLADFGIGIITDRSKLKERAITETGFTQMTLDMQSSQTGTRIYAPPEVLVGRPFTVQGDVYALGIILYQLVVADLNRPLAEGWERDVGDELLREDIAACVEGDPSRRLASAADLAKRLRALPHRRQWKTEERHKARGEARRRRATKIAIGSASALLLLLVVAGAFLLRERSLRREAERARAAEARQKAVANGIYSFLEQMLTSVEPDLGLGGKDVTVVKVIDAAYDQLHAAHNQRQPEVEAAVLKTLGAAYRSLGENERSEKLLRESLAITEKIKGRDEADTHNVRGELAWSLRAAGKLDEAEGLYRVLLPGLERTLGWENDLTLDNAVNYSLLLIDMHRIDQAKPLIRRVYETEVRRHGPESEQALTAMETLTGATLEGGDVNAAAEMFQRIYDARRKLNGDEHPLTLLAASNAATLKFRTGHPADAEPILARVVEATSRTLGETHPRTLAAMQNVATAKDALGQRDEALAIEQKILEIRRRTQGEEHPDTLAAVKNVASTLTDLKRGAEAEQMLRKILQVQRRVLGEAHPDTLNTGNSLASSLVVQNRFAEAEAIHKSVIATALQKLGQSDPNTITYLMNYAGGFHVNKRYADEVQQLLVAWEGAQSPTIPKTLRARIAGRLAMAYELLGQTDEAGKFRALAEAATRPAPATVPAVARAATSSPS